MENSAEASYHLAGYRARNWSTPDLIVSFDASLDYFAFGGGPGSGGLFFIRFRLSRVGLPVAVPTTVTHRKEEQRSVYLETGRSRRELLTSELRAGALDQPGLRSSFCRVFSRRSTACGLRMIRQNLRSQIRKIGRCGVSGGSECGAPAHRPVGAKIKKPPDPKGRRLKRGREGRLTSCR